MSPAWLGVGDHCEWSGVTCNDDLKVTELALGNLGLTGEYPATLGSLSKLNSLSTAGNGFTATIPNDVCSISDLSIVADETNCPNAVDVSGCCDAVRMTNPSPYLDEIVTSKLGSSDCSSMTDHNANVCTFMRNPANHYVFDEDQYPVGFPYENWLEVSNGDIRFASTWFLYYPRTLNNQ